MSNQGSADNYRVLLEKLDAFIRKYYVNQLIRGILYTVGVTIGVFLLLNFLESTFYFSSSVRKVLFYGYLTGGIAMLGFWVLTPLLHYFRLGRLIDHETAATIIGDHFPDVNDKLLNILQLKKQSEHQATTDLVLAGIQQKANEIKLVPFKAAIDLSKNKKYLRYALPPLLLLLVLLVAAPSWISSSTRRLLENNKEFAREAPFRFKVVNDQLKVVQFEDFDLNIQVEGAVLPNEVYIDINGYEYKLNKTAPNLFSYKFANVQKNTDFRLYAGKVASESFTLDVVAKPNIENFSVQLNYPAYTLRTDEKVTNSGDLVVPEGTNIQWLFNARNTENVWFSFNNSKQIAGVQNGSDVFVMKKRASRSESYRVYLGNSALPQADSVVYSITVIPDNYPTINVEKLIDSANTGSRVLYFAGDASDDYGIQQLTFNYRIKHENGKEDALKVIGLSKKGGKQVQYNHVFDLDAIQLAPGDDVSYYFEVRDNDGVNGSKAARTQVMSYKLPSVEEFRNESAKSSEEVKKKLAESIKESKKVQQDLKKIREKLLQEKQMDWQTKKEFEKLLEKQKEIEKQLEQAKKEFQENKENQEKFDPASESVQEKQEQLEKLFNEALNEEMKKLIEQIQQMMQQLEKDSALEMTEQMQMNSKELEKEMDRLLELYKQLEVESDMQKQIEDLEKLSEEQEKLSQETEKNSAPQEELKEKQDEINKEFDKLQEKMEETMKKNEALERPKDLDSPKEDMKSIDQDLDQSKEQLNQKQNSKASQSQQKAAKKMKSAANKMRQQMQESEMQQQEEDIKAMRQLLENLMTVSFDQESLMKEVNGVIINTPRYVELVQEQYKLKDDFKIVEDSLQALAKRVFQIESFVTEKVGDIQGSMNSSIEELVERRKSSAAEFQQRTMKNVNDLALMLSESMDQMQQQMQSSQQSGNQSCPKPGQGGGKPKPGKQPMDKISKGQQELNQILNQLKERMQKGGQGQGASSKEFAQMAAKQAALRRALQEIQKEKKQQGKGDKELQEILDQMDKTETELVNKRLSNDMMKRQQDILTKLLEAEKAERERGEDEKRKSETASQQTRKLPPNIEEYLRRREAEIELYKNVSPALKPYYRALVDQYLERLQK